MLDTPELRGRIQQQETEKFIIRVMVALIILYDHIHPTGAFAKGIDVIVLSQLGHEIIPHLLFMKYTITSPIFIFR